jgi:hypothetical protein
MILVAIHDGPILSGVAVTLHLSARRRQSRGVRTHPRLYRVALGPTEGFEVVIRLQVQPELGGGAEVEAEPKCGVRRDVPPAGDDLAEPVRRHVGFR